MNRLWDACVAFREDDRMVFQLCSADPTISQEERDKISIKTALRMIKGAAEYYCYNKSLPRFSFKYLVSRAIIWLSQYLEEKEVCQPS
ncbi:hypothetical protein A3H65_01235 [Candidatus Giovannonibacteria bacterium RIFCSPLOWO2_02_FULL_45_14]|uniref:Uncharacterized protein n=1 Tax=Candidatus Giovannonibacteria bacterium RIFCSPLOWO2_12_FULL_44_15 TaxID=1798364 RepID=A0A1F5Y0T1_9BACT|nr:MAG: hypothetical protein A3C75_00825 [Candidatus Giovannonibacteria bacterium RIFCSPHIGHO2_02_FULL_44_31]OGF76405.1 MAG: hypothetical protein A3E62_00805 [Candidatus Giovannonibacteria bacterium RIFCSPHIGHO2_12_FULL_44_29]OGF91077.1 MAG: hypothetical protein A3H65_01235 [Candidatus Giovannonibacteria bacterium RIFCSPLOWO2_02_FULL_45_14]OGF93774.1 MAG: hypothetical protein A3G54_02600 [Candidatus Giovannonibacteria bacterium RIFCSPLOWO2_12_FULL_44_15]